MDESCKYCGRVLKTDQKQKFGFCNWGCKNLYNTAKKLTNSDMYDSSVM